MKINLQKFSLFQQLHAMYKKLSLLIPKELHHKLKKHALDTDTTVTAILIDLINTYVPGQTK